MATPWSAVESLAVPTLCPCPFCRLTVTGLGPLSLAQAAAKTASSRAVLRMSFLISLTSLGAVLVGPSAGPFLADIVTDPRRVAQSLPRSRKAGRRAASPCHDSTPPRVPPPHRAKRASGTPAAAPQGSRGPKLPDVKIERSHVL